ncbi:hypothetical protein BCS96_04330 [Vibrio breoganii]|uniref:hypothetical protein n=1 Tax=Vibrio breoganii TaxID=553239 RepID=UPI000C81E3B0|nr:hypothetical protein [Vibrio breoganii]PMG34859.1 hypothetical protein BCU93_18125 [Vibrio breoganii]PMG82089.1 hypothetical protein BCU81_16775 [Vibrio breoganii]PML82606.1 hypothetical protein BCT68_12055 [Vibrio breoganii]PMM50174.1 hypothetical protein BCT52_02795 [Vibrio breoganii]PMP01130.1 hypothetical protein BCS96_04330 [Vibrio breoganii]
MRVLIVILFFVSGCQTDAITTKPSDFICGNAENRFIDGSEGFRDVIATEYGGTTYIGYSHNAELVPHSECAPAITTISGTETQFQWFKYGQPSAVDGVVSLTFSIKNDRQHIVATRIPHKGVANEEYVETDINTPEIGRISKRVWTEEFSNLVITAEDRFDGSSTRTSEATLKTTSKTKYWDENGQQWDCYYVSNTNNKLALNCENEIELDIEYFGFTVPLSTYLKSLSQEIGYEIDSIVILSEVERYIR